MSRNKSAITCRSGVLTKDPERGHAPLVIADLY